MYTYPIRQHQKPYASFISCTFLMYSDSASSLDFPVNNNVKHFKVILSLILGLNFVFEIVKCLVYTG